MPTHRWFPADLDIYVAAEDWKDFVTDITDPNGLNFRRCVSIRCTDSADGVTEGEVVTTAHVEDVNVDDTTIMDDMLGGIAGDGAAGANDTGTMHGTEEQGNTTAGTHIAVVSGPGQTLDSEVQNGDGQVTDIDPDDADAVETEDSASEGGSGGEDSGSDYGSEDTQMSPLHHVRNSNGFLNVRKFLTPSGLTVDVIRSPSGSPITPLRFFWSTLVMNFLTPQACVCGYPSATLQGVGIMKRAPIRRRDNAAKDKYISREFRFVGEEHRDQVDMWDHLFFGERSLVEIDFRTSPEDPRALLPLKYTSRGWVAATAVAPTYRGEFCKSQIRAHDCYAS